MMVRLEVKKRIRKKLSVLTFQFHDGAIGRLSPNKNKYSKPTFQFHDGAIGRVVLK